MTLKRKRELAFELMEVLEIMYTLVGKWGKEPSKAVEKEMAANKERAKKFKGEELDKFVKSTEKVVTISLQTLATKAALPVAIPDTANMSDEELFGLNRDNLKMALHHYQCSDVPKIKEAMQEIQGLYDATMSQDRKEHERVFISVVIFRRLAEVADLGDRVFKIVKEYES